MANKKDTKFNVAGKSYPAFGIAAVMPSEDGCIVRWLDGKTQEFKGITSQEVLFKIDDAKASTDSH